MPKINWVAESYGWNMILLLICSKLKQKGWNRNVMYYFHWGRFHHTRPCDSQVTQVKNISLITTWWGSPEIVWQYTFSVEWLEFNEHRLVTLSYNYNYWECLPNCCKLQAFPIFCQPSLAWYIVYYCIWLVQRWTFKCSKMILSVYVFSFKETNQKYKQKCKYFNL